MAYADNLPWCPQCEWNLDTFDPVFEERDEGILGALNRRAHAIGFRQGKEIVEELSGHEVPRPVPTAGSITLIAVSAVLYTVIAVLVFGGAWLISRLQPVEFFAGLAMIGVGWALRPRLGSRRRAMKVTWELSRDKTPAIFSLVDRVAAELGGRTPRTVAVGVHWNMEIGRFGLLRREVLTIGLPLFVTAQPQERIALLAHELGHQVNGDARRGLLTQPAVTAFGRLSRMTRLPIGGHVVYALAAMVLRLVSWLLLATHLGMNLLGAKESRRAEHYADQLSARIAGTRAAQSALDLIVLGPQMERLIDGIAARPAAAGTNWKASVDGARQLWSEGLDVRRQLTLRTEASAFASHPATALRHRLLGSTPFHDPALALTDDEIRRVDAELAGYAIAYDRFLRQLAGPSAE